MEASTPTRPGCSTAGRDRCGRTAGWSNTSRHWSDRRRRLGLVDLHTGLGPWGHGELISHEGGDAAGYQRGTAWWGDVRSMLDGESVSAQLSGDWLGALDDLLPDVEITAVALEFGTVDVVSVLQALRADAVLHAHGEPRGPEAASVRSQVRAAFADDDPAWFDAVSSRFDEVVDAAMADAGWWHPDLVHIGSGTH